VVFFLRGFTVESVLLFDLGRDWPSCGCSGTVRCISIFLHSRSF
jgi:hypothetical protein